MPRTKRHSPVRPSRVPPHSPYFREETVGLVKAPRELQFSALRSSSEALAAVNSAR